MQNEFGEEISYHRAKPKQPWPIKLAMRFGAKSEQQATTFVLITSMIFLIITIIIYANLFSDLDSDLGTNLESLSPELKQKIESSDTSDLNPNLLLPSERKELQNSGVEF